MKNILLFAGDTYYPQGGANDLYLVTDNQYEAQGYADSVIYSKRKASEWSEPWAQIFDLDAQAVIMQYQKGQWIEHDKPFATAVQSIKSAIEGLPPCYQMLAIERAAQDSGMCCEISHIQDSVNEPKPNAKPFKKYTEAYVHDLYRVLTAHVKSRLSSDNDLDKITSMKVDSLKFHGQKEAGITTVLGLRIEYV